MFLSSRTAGGTQKTCLKYAPKQSKMSWERKRKREPTRVSWKKFVPTPNSNLRFSKDFHSRTFGLPRRPLMPNCYGTQLPEQQRPILTRIFVMMQLLVLQVGAKPGPSCSIFHRVV